jgi:outer membrane receptor for ferrienterochelin and colicin
MKAHYIRVILFLVIFLFSKNIIAQNNSSIKKKEILHMSIEDMMNMEVVTASKVKQKIQDVPACTRVITAQDILERGYFTLEEALADLPGFQFRNILGFNTYSFIRGLPSQNNLIIVMIDGIQINELNSGGFYGGGQYNLSNVKRIEVVYGPASALYGTNAVSGIINIITKKPGSDDAGHAGIGYGSFAKLITDFSYDYIDKNNDFGIRLAAMYKQNEKAKLNDENGDYNWTNDMENFEDNLSFDAMVKFKGFTWGTNFQDKKASRTTNYKTIDDKYLDNGTSWNIRFLNSFLQHSYNNNEKWTNQAKIYFRNATVKDNTIGYIIKADSLSEGEQVGYFRPNHLIGIEEQFNYNPFDKLNLIAGLVFELENLSEGFTKSYSNSQFEEPEKPEKPNVINNNLLSFYLQSQYRIFKTTAITAGIRQNISNYYGNILTPRLALVYNKNAFTAKVLYNRAFRAPKPWDYTWGDGNNNLKPERMKSGEIFASYRFAEHFNIEGSIFRNNISDLFVKETIQINDSTELNRWANKDKVTTLGFETGIKYYVDKFQAYINYTNNHSQDKNDQHIAEISDHIANIGLTYKPVSNLIINLRANYLGERKYPKEIETTDSDIIDDLVIFHLAVTYYISGFNIQLITNNLLDSEYYHTSNRPPDRYRQPQRSVFVKMTYTFGRKTK